MKTAVLAALLFTSTLTIGTVAAQPAPYNEIGVTMGHWHIISKDVEANKKIFLGMGGKLFMPGGNPLMMFPGIYINLNLGTEKGDGGTQGSVVNHVGFIVDNVQERVAQWKAAGVPVLPGNNNRLDRRSSRRRTACASKSWKIRRNRCRSGMNMFTSSCPKPRFPKLRPGTRRHSAVRPAPATTRRSSTFRAVSSGLPRPTRNRRRPAGACSTTLVST